MGEDEERKDLLSGSAGFRWVKFCRRQAEEVARQAEEVASQAEEVPTPIINISKISTNFSRSVNQFRKSTNHFLQIYQVFSTKTSTIFCKSIKYLMNQAWKYLKQFSQQNVSTISNKSNGKKKKMETIRFSQ